ncbi:hypothetical protein GGR58DRAFT_487238 [Xylaria digitata]|nr:hypothetical protein GGR58DRAFT_487238 [Xylaria digitata]
MWSIASQQHIKRLQDSSSVCYDVCNNANIEAQSLGKTSLICESDSVFLGLYTECLACLQEQPSEEISSTVDPALAQYIDYCESIGIAVPKAITTTVVITLDHRIVTIPITTVLGPATDIPSPLSSNSTTPSTPNLTASVTQRPSFSPTLPSSASYPTTNTPSLNSSSHAQSQAWIAGVAVGSIAGVILVVVLPGFLWYCHRRRQRHELPDPFEKPQLHSDCIPRQELEGTQISELEALVAELEGTKQLPELPDTNGKGPGKAPT